MEAKWTVSCAVVVLGLAVCASALPAKKSPLSLADLSSSMNGASRLRYGKRGSVDPELFDTIAALHEAGKRSEFSNPHLYENLARLQEIGKRSAYNNPNLYENLMRLEEAGKRSMSFGADRLNRLAAAMNGAERPRYG